MDHHVTRTPSAELPRGHQPDGGGPRRYLVTILVMGAGIGFTFALGYYSILWMSGDAVAASEGVLAHIAAGDTRAAYEEAAPELQTRQTPGAFAASMAGLGLQEHRSVSWTSRTVDHRGARLVGDVETRSGDVISITVTVIHRDDQWTVASIIRTPPPKPRKLH